MTTRRSLLTAALGFAGLAPRAPELRMLHAWLDTWSGVGALAVGMARQDFDLELTRYNGRGWRATFYVSGMEHSATGAIGSAFEPTPWSATQQAAWRALRSRVSLQ